MTTANHRRISTFLLFSLCLVLIGIVSACVKGNSFLESDKKIITSTDRKNILEDSLQYDREWIRERDLLLKHSSCGFHTLEMKRPSKPEIQHNWEIAWKWAKRGNLQARQLLMFRIVDEGLLSPMGENNRVRDTVILAVHSLGSNTDKENMFLSVALGHIRKDNQSKKFWTCIKDRPSKECTKIAVESKIVPPFDKYVEEVDSAIADGKQASCIH